MRETAYLTGNEQILDKLQKLPFLQSLDKRYLVEMLKMSKIRIYGAGEVITPEGSYDCWIYIMIDGEVVIKKKGSEVARLRRVGDTFGEMGIIDGEARSASVEALIDTSCLAVDASFLDRLSPTESPLFYSVFYRLLSEILAHRLRNTSEERAKVKNELSTLKQQNA